MNLRILRAYFHGLAFLATLLLWGISAWNGTVKALIVAVYHGQFPDGTPLQTRYTGIPLVDLPIALLVAFFFYGTNGSVAGYQLFLLNAYSTLQSAFVWLYVESFRQSSTKPKWIAQPMIFGLLWQAFGAAISLPLYYALHLSWLLQARTAATSSVDPQGARVMPIGFLLGAFLPAVIGMMPTWTGAASRSAVEHQGVLAAWQPDPLWVSGIQLVAGYILSRIWRGRAETKASSLQTQSQTASWVRGSYFLAAASSVSGHLYSIIKTVSNPELSLWHMYSVDWTGGDRVAGIAGPGSSTGTHEKDSSSLVSRIMSSLAGKVIAITGAASGIGLATARLLAQQGALLSLADINETQLTKVASSLRHLHPGNGSETVDPILTTPLDVRSAQACKDWISKTVAHFQQPLSGAANLAGVFGQSIAQDVGAVRNVSDAEAEFVLDVNCRGTFHCLRAELAHMKTGTHGRGGGSIVNAASIAGIMGVEQNGPYVASKHAVVGWTKTVAKEEGKRAIRVNAIAP
ncbi:hypothetical protein BJX61DRAFT_535657 [Aspergillus egyptiacus]|nr:hypothetical protein BJX61DRAFT_535657 [Aspergillus egyptiacus]